MFRLGQEDSSGSKAKRIIPFLFEGRGVTVLWYYARIGINAKLVTDCVL
jgi:hypothetical protein